MQMRLPEARAALEQALEGAVLNDDRIAQRRVGANLGLIDKASGDYASAEARWRRALDLSIEQREWLSAHSNLNNLGNLLRHQRRYDECEPVALEALRLCRQHSLDSCRPFALIGLAQLQAARGRHDSAREYLELLAACDPATVERAVEAGAEQLRAEMALDAGALDAAGAHIVRALEISQRHDDAANRTESLALHARCLWARGDCRSAEALWRTLHGSASTHASLRDEIAAHLQTRGLRLDAESAPVDTALLVETLLAARPR
jgi:tetratricopeptide (TPR) repeat protein